VQPKFWPKKLTRKKNTKTFGPNVFALRREGLGVKYNKEESWFLILKCYYLIKQLWYAKKSQILL